MYEDLKDGKDIEYNKNDLVTFYQEVLTRRDEISKERSKLQKWAIGGLEPLFACLAPRMPLELEAGQSFVILSYWLYALWLSNIEP